VGDRPAHRAHHAQAEGIVSTVSDRRASDRRRLVPPLRRKQRLFPGPARREHNRRALMTNDGLLCYRLTHPRFGVARVYHVRVRGHFDDAQARRLERMAKRTSARLPRPTRAGTRPRETVRPASKCRASPKEPC
jgi:hypothetical protein